MPNELLIRVVLQGGVLPGAVAFILLGLAWWRHARRPADADGAATAGDRGGPRWLLPLLLAAGFGVSFWVVEQSIELWPAANTRRLYHAALLVGLIGAAEGAARMPWVARGASRALAFAGVTWMLSEGYSPNVLSAAQLWTLVAGAGVGGAALAGLGDRGLARTAGWTGPVAALALVGPLQPFLHFAGYSSGSIALTGVVAVLTSSLLIAAVFRGIAPGPGTVTVLVGLVLVSLLGAGVQSEPKSVPALALVAAAPLAWAVSFRGTLPTLAVRGTLASLALGGAIAMAMTAGHGPAEDDPYADYYAD